MTEAQEKHPEIADTAPDTDGLADLVAFGRPYIANPDLVDRLATGAPLADVDWKTVYASGPRGYTDYPTHQPQDNHESGPAKDNTSRRLSKP
jgi:2,4-dienoyl-CoA reductase-like NADH-dependent reductase (Old Yellow Enzyme family)